MRGLLGAVSFLTRVPTGTGERRVEELAGFVPWFPVVGAGVGLVIAAIYAASRTLWPPLPAATVAVVAGIGLTGAFHEDGLGDTADALAGGTDRDSTIRILKDPRLGTFGVLAVAASLLLGGAMVILLWALWPSGMRTAAPTPAVVPMHNGVAVTPWPRG